MLERMFIGDPPGNYDRILDFSTAVTGTLFFVPTADFLDDPPGPADPTAPPGEDDEPAVAGPGRSDTGGDRLSRDRWAARAGFLAAPPPRRGYAAAGSAK